MNDLNSARRRFQAVVVGAGGQGLRRAQALKWSGGWELSGLVDSDPAVLQRVGRRLACPTALTLPQMLDSRACDVVVIATPPVFHNEAIETALLAGKHVLCEKPLTIDPQLTIELTRLATSKNLLLATGFNHRFYKPVIDTLHLVRSGEIGKIGQITARIGHPPSPEILTGWLGRVEISGGGVLTDNGSHLIDLIRLFAGDICDFQDGSFQFSPEHDLIDTRVETGFHCNSGISGQMLCSWAGENRHYLEFNIQGSLGSVEFSAFPWELKARLQNGRIMKRHYLADRIFMKAMGLKAPGLEMSLIRELSAFRGLLLNTRNQKALPPIATAEDGLAVAHTIEQLRQSINTDATMLATIPMAGKCQPETWARSA